MPSKDIIGWYESKSGFWYNERWYGIAHIKAICDQCGVEYFRRRWRTEESKFGKLFCGRSCAKTYGIQFQNITHLAPFNFKKGQMAYNFKGVTHHSSGYICEFEDGEARLQHRLVVERFLGRKLKRTEVIHHIDGDKTNNSIENLQLMTQSEHTKVHQPALVAGRKNAQKG